jgi:hypothetical protein
MRKRWYSQVLEGNKSKERNGKKSKRKNDGKKKKIGEENKCNFIQALRLILKSMPFQ